MAATFDQIDWTGVASAVREGRSASGLSPEAAAQKLCLSKKQILALENGSGAPFPGESVRSWCGHRYAALLGLDWDHLVQAPGGENQAAAAESMPAPARPVEPKAAPRLGRPRSQVYVLFGAPLAALAVVIVNNQATTDYFVPVAMPAAKAVAKLNPPAVATALTTTGHAVNSAPPIDHQVAADGEAAVADLQTEAADKTQASAASRNSTVEAVIEIQGRDPAKQAGSFFVSSNEQVALLKKEQNSPGAGIRIDLAQGAQRRIPIAPTEIVRVAEGRDLGIFYQGRKVPAKLVESGAWVHFVRNTSESSD